jgi:hypothetical protein
LTEWHYRHHGLTLSCNEPTPNLQASAPPPADVSIAVLDPGEKVAPEWDSGRNGSSPSASRWVTSAGTCLRLFYAYFDHWAEFVIDERGQSVRVARSENVQLDDVIELLTSQVFSCLLAQRRLTCLHAAAVEVERRGIALVGATGAGKSTIAMALLARGAALLSDDVAVLRERGGRCSVSVGTPRVRLRPDAARRLVGTPTALEPIWAHGFDIPEKRYLETSPPRTVWGGERELDAVCLLNAAEAADEKPRLRPLPPTDALPRLMANRHMADVLDRDSTTRDFVCIGHLVTTVPTFELVRPYGLASIEETVAVIETGMRQLG